MINELDTVVLLHDLEDYSLIKGDIGTVVHRYHDGLAFEAEFVRADGSTLPLLTLQANEIRSMHRGEILHVRELMPA